MENASVPEGLVEFPFEGRQYRFRAATPEDHMLGIMTADQSFYELDVLERIRSRRKWEADGSLAVDAGAYLGTHSTYFASVCDCERVISFEANSESFKLLNENLLSNDVADRVTPHNKALGAQPGHASIAQVDLGINQGATSLVSASEAEGSVVVTTIDVEIGAIGQDAKVSLIKIDVEGAELEVLRGAASTIRRCRPLLCIEVHSGAQLRQVLRLLRGSRYQIVDCLGYSPTYVIEPTERGAVTRALVNGVWLARAYLPDSVGRVKSCLRRLGQSLTTGRWDPPSSP